jgi:hypothetical protein
MDTEGDKKYLFGIVINCFKNIYDVREKFFEFNLTAEYENLAAAFVEILNKLKGR